MVEVKGKTVWPATVGRLGGGSAGEHKAGSAVWYAYRNSGELLTLSRPAGRRKRKAHTEEAADPQSLCVGVLNGRRICPLRPANVPQTSRKSDFHGPILNVSVFNAFRV